MRKLMIMAVGAVMAATFAGCGEKGAKREVVALESFGYDTIGKFKDSLDFDLSVEGAKYVRLHARGVLPIVSGKEEGIELLRDTLEKLGCVRFEKGGKPVALVDNELEFTNLTAEESQAASEMYADLSVSLVTPDVVVWKIFNNTYMAGAAHSQYQTRYLNYSVADGKILKLSDLMKKDYRPLLLEKLRERLSERDDLLLALRDIDIPDVFEITSDGIDFVYGIYAVAPYSSGEIRVSFNAYELNDILTPAAIKMISGIEM